METLVIDNFHGSMTPYANGDINSGKSFWSDVSGYDPFSKPGSLTWNETSEQIDPAGAVITDLILCGKTRMESGILYVYAIGHTGRVYKIQVNDPTTYNPDYDNPILLTTLTIESPTFTRGGFIDFYGATEKIYIGHDKGVTSLNFDGTGEAFVGVVGSWIQNVPRPFVQFVGKLYIGNGTNLAEIDSTATVTTYGKLAPAFPTNTQVRDLDITPDGTYLQAIVTELALTDITATTTDTSLLAPVTSFMFMWNGTDMGYTSFITYPATALSANTMFGDQQYIFGYDTFGGAVFNPVRKTLTSIPNNIYGNSPLPNAVISMGGIMSWIGLLPFEGVQELVIIAFGTIADYDIAPGYWCIYDQFASGTETDIQQVPCQILVSNYAQGTSSNGYVETTFGKSKVYFSTLETSAGPTTSYKLWKWSPSSSGLGTPMPGLFQTQTQLFSKKVDIKEIRVYGDPWVAGNSFKVELIGPGNTVITNSSYTFTVGTTLNVGDDFAWYNPPMAPTYGVGIRITNLGDTHMTINKVEIDYTPAGK